MTETILDKIVADRKKDVAEQKRHVPLSTLKKRAAGRKPRDFRAALSGDGVKLIAEIKKASPSRGLLCPDFRPAELARTYERNGAAAISVLTETHYFQGSFDHLATVRESAGLPLLRKDFIFDEYQVYETAAGGADALLLIAAILHPELLSSLLKLSRSLGLECLVEVHTESETAIALNSGAEIIGINNRDLNTFKTDIHTTRRLRSLVPGDKIVVSESGIRRRDDIIKLRNWGVNAVLVGEALVTAPDIPARIKELLA
jgi:indole-3-glycerol phosphate synthase